MLKKSDVKLGGVYIAKVTNRLVRVRIDKTSRYGGWEATNLTTGKPIRVKSAQRLRSAVAAEDVQAEAQQGKVRKKPTTTPEADTAQTVAATGQPETEPAAVPVTCPNCGGTEADEDGDCAQCHEPRISGRKAKQPRHKKANSDKPKRLSGLDAAAKILEETGQPMNVKQLTEVALAKGYWKPAGRTPSATLASALMREIAKKGKDARFRKSERGKFALNR